MSSMPLTLKAEAPRGHVSEEMAREFLSKFQGQVTAASASASGDEDGDGASSVETLDISCLVWVSSSLDILKDFFVTHVVPTIRYLNMDDVIASLETSIGLQTIRFLTEVFQEAPFLERIDANDNALGERAGDIMRPLFSLKTLKRLSLDNCGMSTAVGQQLIDSLPNPTALTHLSLDRNQMGPEGAEKFATVVRRSPHLEYLSYAGCRPGVVGTRHVAAALSALANPQTKLTHLDMNDCTFKSGENDDDPIFPLIEVLNGSPSLETLILRDGEFGSQGTASLITALEASGAKLKKLDLGAVELTPEDEPDGLEAVIGYVQNAGEALEELYLDTNELGNDGVSTLIKALASATVPNLVTLSLAGNEIEEDGAQALVDNPVPSLKKLILEDNMDIPPEQGKKLVKMYETVVLDEDILPEEEEEEEVEEDKDAGVDALAEQLQKAL